jgi:hypothetical protein
MAALALRTACRRAHAKYSLAISSPAVQARASSGTTWPRCITVPFPRLGPTLPASRAVDKTGPQELRHRPHDVEVGLVEGVRLRRVH